MSADDTTDFEFMVIKIRDVKNKEKVNGHKNTTYTDHILVVKKLL
jgi:hypothetical protein